jgi:hypothetical protein
MIDSLAEYLRSQRTLSAAEVARRACARARFDLSPNDRFHNTIARPCGQAARH